MAPLGGLRSTADRYGDGAALKNIKQAVNDFRKTGYGGPCPPHGHGPHHYHFRLLALSTDHLRAQVNASCSEIEGEARKSTVVEAILVVGMRDSARWTARRLEPRKSGG